MKKKILTLVFTCILSFGFAQSLKEQLWNFASHCNEAIIDGYIDASDKEPEKLNDYYNSCIDDSKNGYLFIEGSWPTCGCSCSNEIGAYKKADGSYTLFRYETWPCSNSFGIYTNEKLTNVLPENLSLKTFNSISKIDTLNYFHLKMTIPRVGTDTKVSLKLLPLGQVGVGKVGISYDSKNSKILHPYLYSIKSDIAEDLQNDVQLQLILNKKIGDLPENIKNKILSQIGKNKRFKSEEELITELSYMKKVYDVYSSLQYTEIIFSWNRRLGRFEIKEKTGKPKQASFLEFILKSEYFSALC